MAGLVLEYSTMPSHSYTNDWEPSEEEALKKPWKYIGYQSFSKFVASDNDFFILRRFSALTARVLLGLQDQLSQLEKKLEALEKRLRQENVPDTHNGSFRNEGQSERKELVLNAQSLLVTYSQ